MSLLSILQSRLGTAKSVPRFVRTRCLPLVATRSTSRTVEYVRSCTFLVTVLSMRISIGQPALAAHNIVLVSCSIQKLYGLIVAISIVFSMYRKWRGKPIASCPSRSYGSANGRRRSSDYTGSVLPQFRQRYHGAGQCFFCNVGTVRVCVPKVALPLCAPLPRHVAPLIGRLELPAN